MNENELRLQALEKKLKTTVGRTPPKQIDPHKPVPEFCERFLKQFGRNPYGDPLYRVVWGEGPQNEIITGGLWFDNDKVEYRKVKSPNIKKYILMKWLPAEMFGSPRTFFSEESNNVDHGFWSDPIYPWRGRYEHVHTFQEYPSIAYMSTIIIGLRATKLYTKQERINADLARAERERKIKESQLEDLISSEMLSHTGTPYFLKKCAEFEAKKKLSALQIQNKMGMPETGFAQIKGK